MPTSVSRWSSRAGSGSCSGRSCATARFPAAAQAGERAYIELMRMVVTAYGVPDEALATLHWSLVHGLASLMVDGGMADRMPSERAQRAHIDAVLEAFVDMTMASTAARRAVS
jgi:hypothetical protein